MTKPKDPYQSDLPGWSQDLESAPPPVSKSDPTPPNCAATPPVSADITAEPTCPVSGESSESKAAPPPAAVVRNNVKRQARPKTMSAKQRAKKRAKDREYKRRERAKKVAGGFERLELSVPTDLGARMRAEMETLGMESVGPLALRALLREFPPMAAT